MSRSQLQALCCNCGTVRMTTDYGGSADETDVDCWARFRAQGCNFPPARCIVLRQCKTCGHTTKHAFIRDDEERNEAETADHLSALPTQLEVWEILNEIRARGNVRVREIDVAPDDEYQHMGVSITHYLYEDTWTMSIYGRLPINELACRLREVQKRMADPEALHGWFVNVEDGRKKPSVNAMWIYSEPES